MVDGITNICLVGNLSLLVDVVDIPPLPILVAVEGDGMSMADCCTNVVFFHLHWRIVVYTIKRATFVPLLLKQSYRLKRFLMLVIY
jgi:hypothetical protein